MPLTTPNTQWKIAAGATVLAGVGLVLLQPLWREGLLYTLFQACLILWLRPVSVALPTVDPAEALSEETRRLRLQLNELKELLKRVLPLWGEQIQQAQDQLNMPGTQVLASTTRSQVNLILDAARADMYHLCELNCYEHNHRSQSDNWLSTFANADSEPPQKHARLAAPTATKNASRRTARAPYFLSRKSDKASLKNANLRNVEMCNAEADSDCR